MHIETKFSNGDRVFWATTRTAYKKLPCAECNETGRLAIQGKTMTVDCYECYGKGYFDTWSEIEPDAREMTIGRVEVRIADSPGVAGSDFDNYKPKSEREEQYMCVETGVGSGSIYHVGDLFATEAEALDRAVWKVVEAKKYRAEEAEREEKRRQQLAAQYRDKEAEA